ncbi:MAG: hypothetical protein GY866_07540 [Proteobacteria bacterium]|nr:hypothetical protein [Pseudomonadota bacterium]
MSQITLRKIPENLEKQIRVLAQKNHTSLNKTIIDLLEKALGTERTSKKKRDLSQLAGTWSEREAKEFEKNISQFERIDEEIWKQ